MGAAGALDNIVGRRPPPPGKLYLAFLLRFSHYCRAFFRIAPPPAKISAGAHSHRSPGKKLFCYIVGLFATFSYYVGLSLFGGLLATFYSIWKHFWA